MIIEAKICWYGSIFTRLPFFDITYLNIYLVWRWEAETKNPLSGENTDRLCCFCNGLASNEKFPV